MVPTIVDDEAGQVLLYKKEAAEGYFAAEKFHLLHFTFLRTF